MAPLLEVERGRPDVRERVVRITRLVLGIGNIPVGVWATFVPRSFYDDFPGFGRHWVQVDGPYNEHLVRDFGAVNLALAVVTITAAILCGAREAGRRRLQKRCARVVLANCRPLAGPRPFDRHLREMVAGGDDTHARPLKAMKGRWKHPISGMGWYRAAKRKFAKLPQD
jgi:hypothetical protein